MTTLWGELFEIVHAAYIAVIGPLFAVAFFGSVLYLVANRKRSSLAARVIRGIRPRKHRALRDHPAICAACGYPRGEGDTCPECGASLTEPGAVLFREVIESRRLPVPRWLTLAAMMLALILGAWMLSPLALPVGNKIEWGAWRIEELYYRATYTPSQGVGSPSYRLQLSCTHAVEPRKTGSNPPIYGQVTFILEESVSKDLGWLQVQHPGETWQLHFHKGGINPPFQPTSSATGAGVEAGVRALYKATGLDQYWQASPAELADAQRLGRLAVGPAFREIEKTSSLSHASGSLVWTPNMAPRAAGAIYRSSQPMPISNTAGVLGIVMLVLPFVVLGIFGLRKLHRR